ncbi:MAG: esterase-like activity of phytase family protein [Cyanobacteria bacterium]|nr:esterase-like activity of phytase family protein [Cyanobacteriota bacterium]
MGSIEALLRQTIARATFKKRGLSVRVNLLRGLLLGLLVLAIASGCTLPQVSAEDRLFLDLSLDLLDVTTLAPQTVEGTPVGGLSALSYDRQTNRFYALSDDRGNLAPPRFYTLRMGVTPTATGAMSLDPVVIEGVTLLKDATGEVYSPDQIDPEGMALSPRRSLFITSEGVPSQGSPPQLNEYDRVTGQLLTQFRLPDRYLPDPEGDSPRGIRNNLGFEALTFNPISAFGELEPFRLFTATESALAQDFDEDPAQPLTSRWLHYLINPDQSTLLSEHAYTLALEPFGSVVNGLSELVALDQGGHFLALERAFGAGGFDIKLFQLATGGATDTSGMARLAPLPDTLSPIQKQLVLDFATLAPAVDNLEAMAIGPTLPDGSPTLWLMSDDNFSDQQTTQVWVFRLGLT